jgi:hypothetical protein
MKQTSLLTSLFGGLKELAESLQVFIPGADGPRDFNRRGGSLERRDVAAFRCVKIKGSMAVEITRDDRQSVEVFADKALIGFIRTEVKGDTLEIALDESAVVIPGGRAGVAVSLPNLERVSLHGSGYARALGVDCRRIEIDLQGSGRLDIDGRTDELVIYVQGSGHVGASDLEAAIGEISLAGAGSVEARVRNKLGSTLAGSGSIVVTGRPSVAKSRSAGSGVIRVT